MEPIEVNNSEHKSEITMKSEVVTNAFDQKVDVVGDNECDSSKKVVNDPNETEKSSSFGNSFSGSEEESVSTGMEIESQFFSENPEYEGYNGLSRLSKRRVTDHWRTYIFPLMWRCRWLELRMNELRSQALLYEKKLAAYRREKQLNLKMMELDDPVSRAIPFSHQAHRRVMKRRRRKRIEDEVNVSSYMSSHNVFSYYEQKSTDTGCKSAADDTEVKEAEVDKIKVYEQLLHGLRSDDNSLEEMILNLDHLQSRVNSLKSQLRDVIPKYLHMSFSNRNNRNVVLSQTILDCEVKMSGSSVSSFGDAGVVATDDTPFHANMVKIEDVELSSDDTSELNESTEEEDALYGCEDAKAYLKVPVSAPAVIKTYTGKKRGRKPKKQRQGKMKKDENNNPYRKIYVKKLS